MKPTKKKQPRKQSKKKVPVKGKTPEQIVNDIQSACKLLGWNIAMNESRPGIRGLVIGVNSYVEEIVGQLSDSDAYAIYSSGQDVDKEMH